MNTILKSAIILCLSFPSGAYAKQLVGDDFTKPCSGGTKTCHLVSNDRGATWVGPFCGPCTAAAAAGIRSTGSKAEESDRLITIRSANGNTTFRPGEKFPQLMGGEEVSIGSGLSGNFMFQVQGTDLQKISAGPGAVFRLKYLNASDGWVLESRSMPINVTTKDGSTTLTPGSNLKLIGVHANASTGGEAGNIHSGPGWTPSSTESYARIGGVGNATSTSNDLAYPTTSSTEMLASGRVVASQGDAMPTSTLIYHDTTSSTAMIRNRDHSDAATNDHEKIAPAPTYQLGLGILFIQAKQTLQELAEAYSAKRRTAFMKLVSPDFSGDTATFEEALVKDFHDYRTVNLSLIPDRVVGEGNTASVEFHYDLTVVNEAGVNKTFSGRSSYTFRKEDGKVRLYKMEKPIIFGNSLTTTENPMDAGQHSLSAAVSVAPGLQSTLRGTAFVAFPCLAGIPGASFQFETQSNKTFTSGLDRSADIFRNGGGNIEALSGGAIASIGDCSLESVSSVPGMLAGISATPHVGECYAVKTGPGKYAVLRVNSIELALSGCALQFNYKYQPSGSNEF